MQLPNDADPHALADDVGLHAREEGGVLTETGADREQKQLLWEYLAWVAVNGVAQFPQPGDQILS